MASDAYIPDSPSVQERLTEVRAFNASAALSHVKSLLATGLLLVLTAKRLDNDAKGRAKCLSDARRCQSRVEEAVWRLQALADFSRLTADMDRLKCEISALEVK
jgi:hypothetical protein